MRDMTPQRWPARRLRFAARPKCGTNTPEALLRRMAFAPLPPDDGPLAPPELRAQEPDADGVRQGLVAYYRDLIARGELDTPDRLARAEARLFRTIR